MSSIGSGTLVSDREWRECKLGEVAKLSKKSWKVGDEPMSYIGLEHIEEAKLRLNGIGKSEDVASNKFHFQAGDTLFGKLRPYFRKVVKPNFDGICSTDIWVINPQKGIDKDFLFYFFTNQELVDISYSSSSGTRMPRADWNFLSQTVWNISPLEEQKAIAEVLSSLDDKIDLLHRQNKTLEELAQTLFRQWFVEGEETISYLFEELVDSISVKHSFNNDKVIFLNTSDVYDGKVLHDNCSTVSGLPGQAKKSIKKGDILFTEIRPANKRFAFIDFEADDYVVSTKLMVLRSKNVLDTAIVYLFLKQQDTLNYLQMLAESRSGTFPQITFDHLKTVEIFVPKDKDILESTTNIFKDIVTKTFRNHAAIKTLKNLRDTLLPKLMSGEVRVIL
jgi:type I restriction enzyme S subunit